MKVLMQRNIVAEFHRKNASFTGKTSELAFVSHPVCVCGMVLSYNHGVWGVRGNLYDLSLASWKAHCRLPIFIYFFYLFNTPKQHVQ